MSHYYQVDFITVNPKTLEQLETVTVTIETTKGLSDDEVMLRLKQMGYASLSLVYISSLKEVSK